MSYKTLNDFNQIIENLAKVLSLEEDDVSRDAAIKRFELCFDLAWKSIKNQAQIEGLECYSPRECFKTAFQLHLIGYEEKWFKMIDDRNLTVHLYSQEQADEVYSRLPGYLKLFKELAGKLRE